MKNKDLVVLRKLKIF